MPLAPYSRYSGNECRTRSPLHPTKQASRSTPPDAPGPERIFPAYTTPCPVRSVRARAGGLTTLPTPKPLTGPPHPSASSQPRPCRPPPAPGTLSGGQPRQFYTRQDPMHREDHLPSLSRPAGRALFSHGATPCPVSGRPRWKARGRGIVALTPGLLPLTPTLVRFAAQAHKGRGGRWNFLPDTTPCPVRNRPPPSPQTRCISAQAPLPTFLSKAPIRHPPGPLRRVRRRRNKEAPCSGRPSSSRPP